MRRQWRWLLIAGLIWMLGGIGVRAQEGDPLTIQMMQTVSGSIDAGSPVARWEFDGTAGRPVSALVQVISGSLNPILQLLDPAGQVVAEGASIAYPDRPDAVLEGVTLEADGRYTLQVSRHEGPDGGSSTGAFTLTLLPAYAIPFHRDFFTGQSLWSGGEAAEVRQRDGQLVLSVTAPGALGWATPDPALAIPDHAYVQVDGAVLNTPGYWQYGLLLHYADPEHHYRFAINSRGQWVFWEQDGDSLRVLQEWTEHPALADRGGAVTLGVAIDGAEHTFYANGELLGTAVVDAQPAGRSVALAVAADDRGGFPQVAFKNLLITASSSFAVSAAPAAPAASVVPAVDDTVDNLNPLQSWQERDSAAIVAELAEEGVIRSDAGSQVMLVLESFTTTARPGMQTLPLGQGRQQTDFIMGSTITLSSEGDGNACGLLFRNVDESRYSLLFLDERGGLGVAEWQQNRFDPAFYMDRDTNFTELTRVSVILVAQDDRVIVYVNGQPVAARANPPLLGRVGIAALSYDGQFVECRFASTWLWVQE